MRAASLTNFGSAPVTADLSPPPSGRGRALVRVDAAPINQLDLLIASGRFYGGAPEIPYVPGVEGVGRVVEADTLETGTRVWFDFQRFDNPMGSMAELCSVDQARMMPIAHDIDSETAAALGLTGVAAWMSLSAQGKIAHGEQVLILGAGGAVGQIAVQAARLLGAGRVVAASRSEEGRSVALKLGADAVVDNSGEDVDLIAGRIEEACDGPLSLVIDPVWGAGSAAAIRALAPNGRLVNLGSAGGPTLPLESAALRSKSLSILGYTNVMLSFDEMCAAATELHRHAAEGRIQVLVETVGIDETPAAFRRAGQSPHRKLVVIPSR